MITELPRLLLLLQLLLPSLDTYSFDFGISSYNTIELSSRVNIRCILFKLEKNRNCYRRISIKRGGSPLVRSFSVTLSYYSEAQHAGRSREWERDSAIRNVMV